MVVLGGGTMCCKYQNLSIIIKPRFPSLVSMAILVISYSKV